MKYKIIGDSSCDVTDAMREVMNIELVPLTLEVDGIRYVDNDELDVANYLEKANSSSMVPKSSCPSPDDYMKAIEGEEEAVFIITLSSELSGSYGSAMLAKSMFQEKQPEKKIHVFDSRSAVSAEVLIALKVQECIEAGMEFEEIVKIGEKFREEMQTIFVLEKIDHLQKAGRMSKMKATIANVLKIKLILQATDKGEIDLVSQARGTKKAIDKMIQTIGELGTVTKDKVIVVAHCQAQERGEQVKEKIQELYDFKEVILIAMKGLSSNYANIGGIVIAY
jgi:DegV family protein with EDD domain